MDTMVIDSLPSGLDRLRRKQIDLIRQYLFCKTCKDVSLFITFKFDAGKNSPPTCHFETTVIDIDPKSHKNIVKYLKQDEEIERVCLTYVR